MHFDLDARVGPQDASGATVSIINAGVSPKRVEDRVKKYAIEEETSGEANKQLGWRHVESEYIPDGHINGHTTVLFEGEFMLPVLSDLDSFARRIRISG